MEYGRCQNVIEDFKNGIEKIFHTSIPIPCWILLMAFTEKYMRIATTKYKRKRLAANHMRQTNRVTRS